MSVGDWFRGFFSKRRNPQLEELGEWLSAHVGVEGYIEPRTATQPTTLLLVDRDGDHIRGAVRDPADAAAFCRAKEVPVYDAAVIGYPRRMRDFESGRGRGSEEVDQAIADIERRFREPKSEE
ncbi:MAG: hypothetical protein ACRDJ5_06120 [Actinomycetota bacterium]